MVVAVYTAEVMSKYFPAVMRQMKDITVAIQAGSKVDGNSKNLPSEEPAKPIPELDPGVKA